MGGPAAGVYFVAHEAYAAQAMKNLGSAKVNAGYPNDHTHTSPAGAKLAAQAFAQAIASKMNGTTSLTDYIVSPAPSVY